MKSLIKISIVAIALMLVSCETATEKEQRLKQEEATRLEEERIKKIYDEFGNNSLNTGSTPYENYYGNDNDCLFNCSEIIVQTSGYDVLVTIKRNDVVVRHAYIQAYNSYTFSVPNGTYQPFFYSGTGWYPDKPMKDGKIRGGFLSDENFGKDNPQYLEDNILTYELIMQVNGNFSTKPSNASEAL